MKHSLALLLAGWWGLCSITSASAQELLTNMQVFENLGVACLESVPMEVDSLILSPPATLPYVTSALINRWQQQGKTLFLADSLRVPNSPFLLSWEVSKSTISYTRVRRKTFSRSAELDLQYTFLGLNGEILAQDTCQNLFSDQIRKGMIPDLESPAYPETQAEPPRDRWVRRHLEPVIIAAATGLAAFLFFNLRNNSADS